MLTADGRKGLRRLTRFSDQPNRALVLMLILAGCSSGSTKPVDAEPAVVPLFGEWSPVAELSGFHFASTQDFEMPGIMGSGCSMIDLDGDHLLDLVLVPGDHNPSSPGSDSGLCRVLIQGQEKTFADRSQDVGIRVKGTGMGAFGGDIDNDGDIDVVTTSAAGVTLFRNAGNLHFEDVTEAAGVNSSHWATVAVFFDYNRDGWLDLFVVNYVDYFPGSVCEDRSGRRDYCGPVSFTGTNDLLYRNRGADGFPGTFENVTVGCGLARSIGKGLGAICSDFNGDRLPDIYVANDMEPNVLWIQDAEGQFHDEASLRGCSVNLQGSPQASMGTVWADLDQDQEMDVFLTHLRGETNTWYRQLSNGVFLDQTSTCGLAAESLNQTGFGVMAADLNLDGLVDLAVVNGRVMRAPLLVPGEGQSHWAEYAENNQIFLASKPGQFTNLPANSDPFVIRSEVSRGLAAGDLDNDGDIDLLVSNIAAPARLFENLSEKNGHWIQLRVLHPGWNRDAIGARVRLSAGGRKWTAEVASGTGYLSSHDPRIHIGLGDLESYDSIDVIWPDDVEGSERFGPGTSNVEVVLEKGKGIHSASAIVEGIP